LLFSTGYQTAQGIIPTLVQRGEYIVSDKDNHACIVAGNLMAKSITANVVRYRHMDLDDMERVIKKLPLESNKLIVSDGVFANCQKV
jgi:8-amino-7-oxononanoate synthase